ncbi:MAG: hypothetical protein K2I49_01165, partial [Ureaplasma sp.]|nr:hypothetical protein [Ureaplasma sp.]
SHPDTQPHSYTAIQPTSHPATQTHIQKATQQHRHQSTTKKQQKDTNIENSNFSLSIYDFISDNGNDNNKEKSQSKIYSSLNSQKYLNNDSFVKNLIKDVLTTIYKEILNYLANNVRFDIELIPFAMTEKGKIPGQFNTNKYWNKKGWISSKPWAVDVDGKRYKWRILEHSFEPNEDNDIKEPIVIDSPRNTNVNLKETISRALGFNSQCHGSTKTVEQYIKDPFGEIDGNNYWYIMDLYSWSGLCDTFGYNSYYSDLFKEKNIVDAGLYATDLTKEDKIIFPSSKISDISDFDVFLSDSKFSNGRNHEGKQIVKKKQIKKIKHYIGDKSSGSPGGYDYGYYGDLGTYTKSEIAQINILGSEFIIAPTRGDYNVVIEGDKPFDNSFFHINNQKGIRALAGAFAVNLRISEDSNISEESLFSYIWEKINSMFLSDSSKATNGKHSFSIDTVVNQLFNLFKKDYNVFAPEIYNMINNDNWIMSYTTDEPDLDIPNAKKLHSLANDPLNVDRNNQFLFSKTINSNKYLKFSPTKSERSSTLLDGVEFNYDAIMNEMVGTSNIRSNLENNNFRIVIEYNNNPLFLIEEPIKFEDMNEKFENIIKKYFFKNENPTKSDLDKIKNFSQSFMSYNFIEYEMNKNSKNYFNIIDEHNKIIYDENGKNWKFVYENNDGYTDNYVSPSLKNRSNDVNGLDHYKINAITDVYNRILRNNRNNDINDIVSPEEIIFLYNEFPGKKLSPIDLKYREFVSNGTNQALSIYHGQDVKLFDNQKDLDYFIQNNTALKPGEVNIFISEDGIPMNPGIKLTDDKKWIPTSDAIYDTKENIFDNLNRTFIVPVSDEYVYY